MQYFRLVSSTRIFTIVSLWIWNYFLVQNRVYFIAFFKQTNISGSAQILSDNRDAAGTRKLDPEK